MLNKVTLIGNLGQDPDVRTSPNGTKIVRISLATTRRWTDRQTQERRDHTEWHRVVFFNRTAEVVEQYLRKGSQVYIEGRIQTQKYQGKDGQDRYSTEIIAEQMQMLGSRSGGSSNFSDNAQSSAPAASPSAPGAFQGPDDFDDDIPF
ncbi:MAG: single-stranded DNA-binding protein [Methylococcales bacterium]|jgi:single-strand DNA-binding protein|nr:single-stranded DNA-binding protein [Methylococcales bacterium]